MVSGTSVTSGVSGAGSVVGSVKSEFGLSSRSNSVAFGADSSKVSTNPTSNTAAKVSSKAASKSESSGSASGATPTSFFRSAGTAQKGGERKVSPV